MTNSPEIKELNKYLQSLEPGKLEGENITIVERLLRCAWEDLGGDYAGGMWGYKILNRTENLIWDPPCLKFNIERHGAVMLGSVYGEIQSWSVNIEERAATLLDTGKRLIGKREKPIKTIPIAAELAEVLKEKKEDGRIRWSKAGKAQIVTSKVFPPACRATTNGRMKRLKRDIGVLLEPLGWKPNPGGWWSPPDMNE